MTDTNRRHATFFDLPVELRKEIYHLVVGDRLVLQLKQFFGTVSVERPDPGLKGYGYRTTVATRDREYARKYPALPCRWQWSSLRPSIHHDLALWQRAFLTALEHPHVTKLMSISRQWTFDFLQELECISGATDGALRRGVLAPVTIYAVDEASMQRMLDVLDYIMVNVTAQVLHIQLRVGEHAEYVVQHFKARNARSASPSESVLQGFATIWVNGQQTQSCRLAGDRKTLFRTT